MTRHYLDAASASALRPIARAAMVQALELPMADPGRIHEEGLTVRHQLELARASVSLLLGARPSEVIFTASASEAINTVVRGRLAAVPNGVVLVSAVEHSAVRSAAEAALRTVPVSSTGLLDPAALSDQLDELAAKEIEVALLACQLGNHEMGAVQPIAAVAEICAHRGLPLLVDAAQAAGRIGIAFKELGADFLAISGPKLGAPPGTGALLVKRGKRVQALICGGEQERGRRAGLENTPAAVGLGAACAELADTLEAEAERARTLTDALRAGLQELEGVEIYGPEQPDARLPHLVCVGIEGVEPQAVLLGLDRAGVAAHSGSACASEDLQPSPDSGSHGRGRPSLASPQRRLGHHDMADVDAALTALPPILASLRALGQA